MSAQHPEPLGFCDLFDEAQAREGLPALFVVNARGELRLASDKTRDAWQRLPRDAQDRAIFPPRQPCHCLLRDRATGWVQYVLATAWELVADHPRADVRRFDSQEAAQAALAALGPVPVDHEAWDG